MFVFHFPVLYLYPSAGHDGEDDSLRFMNFFRRAGFTAMISFTGIATKHSQMYIIYKLNHFTYCRRDSSHGPLNCLATVFHIIFTHYLSIQLDVHTSLPTTQTQASQSE